MEEGHIKIVGERRPGERKLIVQLREKLAETDIVL